MALRRWQELKSGDFGGLAPAAAVAVLPLAATEQHGPHLPTGTDHFIAEGLIAAAAARLPPDVGVVVMPILPIGASREHEGFAGTLSLPAALMAETIVAAGAGAARAGLRKLVLVSSHGGNVAAMTTAALELRARHDLLAVTLTFARLGLPDGLVGEEERLLGVHGGLIETALMLHFRPDLVDMAAARHFPSLQAELVGAHRLLRAYGPVGFGWMAGDLSPHGVVGNAGGATAAIGAAIAAHQAERFATLLAEVAAVDVAQVIAAP